MNQRSALFQLRRSGPSAAAAVVDPNGWGDIVLLASKVRDRPNPPVAGVQADNRYAGRRSAFRARSGTMWLAAEQFRQRDGRDRASNSAGAGRALKTGGQAPAAGRFHARPREPVPFFNDCWPSGSLSCGTYRGADAAPPAGCLWLAWIAP